MDTKVGIAIDIGGTTVRDRILDAADMLLGRYGYKKMTMDDIARAAGIGKATIYLHFEGKQQVVLQRLDRLVDRLLVHLRKVAQQQDSTAAERVRSMLIERVLIRVDAAQHYSESISDLLADLRDVFLRRREEYFQRELDVFEAVIRQGQQSGEFIDADARSLARAAVGATNSLLPYSLTAQELGNRTQIKKQVSDIADLLLFGMQKHHKYAGRITSP